MGPKFAIVFSGVEENSLEEFLKDLKTEIEELAIIEEEEVVEKIREVKGKRVRIKEVKPQKEAMPRINFVVSTYYKGTGLELLTKKLEEYLDTADKDESQINYI